VPLTDIAAVGLIYRATAQRGARDWYPYVWRTDGSPVPLTGAGVDRGDRDPTRQPHGRSVAAITLPAWETLAATAQGQLCIEIHAAAVRRGGHRMPVMGKPDRAPRTSARDLAYWSANPAEGIMAFV